MKKFLKNTMALFLSLSIVVCTGGMAFAGQAPDNMKTVIHAGGVINGAEGTNSLEAVKNTFYNGYRYIELDFNFTSDGHLVCVHDWEKNYFGRNYNFKGAMTLEEFEGLKIYGQYTTLTMRRLQNWLMEKPNTYIITDIKANNNLEGLKYIKENYPYIVNRIMPQIYSENEYAAVKEMGYGNIIYTLYALTYSQKTNTKRIVDFVKDKDICAITFSSELAYQEYVDALKAANTNLFVHTVNSAEETAKYNAMGIYGVYSDVIG